MNGTERSAALATQPTGTAHETEPRMRRGPRVDVTLLVILCGSSYLLWLVALLRGTDSADVAVGPRVVSLVVLAVATVLVPLGIGSVEHLLWGRDSQPRDRYLHAAAATSLTWGSLAALPLSGIAPLALGTGLVAVHLGWLALLTRPAPDRVLRTGAAVIALGLLLAALWPQLGAPLGELVWAGSDQRVYLRQSVALASGELVERYPPGMATLLLPFVLLADLGVAPTDPTGLPPDLAESRLLNLVMLPVSLVMTALMLDVIARLGTRLANRGGLRPFAISLAVVTAVVLAYLALPPDFVPARNVELVPRRLTGLVFSYEPMLNTVLAGLCLALLPRDRPAASRAPLVVAGLAVLAVSAREPVIALAGAFGLCLVSSRAGLPTAWRVAAGAAAFTGVLLGISAAGRGSGEVLGRGSVYDGELLREVAEQRYDWTLQAPPPQLSPRYLLTNLGEQHPLPALVLGTLLLATLVAVVLQRGDWRPWAFLWAVAVVSLAVHGMWVNIVVSYRYNTVLAVPVAAALAYLSLVLVGAFVGRARRARRRGDGR